MIRPVESATPRKGLKWDPKRGRYTGYRADFRSAGKRHRQIFESKKAAETYVEQVRFASKLRKAGVPAHYAPPTVRELLDARHAKIKNAAEKVRARRIFDLFLTLIPSGAKVTDVRSADFTKFRNAREAEGMKLETINRELNPLSKAFSSAAELFPDALEDYEPPKVRRPKFKRKRRERTLSEAEKNKILAFLYAEPGPQETEKAFQNRRRIGRMFEMSWFLGLRYSEIAKMLKSDFNREARTLRVHRWKTGNTSYFEHLPDEVCDLLTTAAAESPAEHLFTISGSPPKKFYEILKEAVESAGIKYGRSEMDGVVFHTLRHSFVSRLVRVTDLATAQTFTGHSTGEMVALYSHASKDEQRRAMEKLFASGRDYREIYEKVRSGEWSFEDFERAIK